MKSLSRSSAALLLVISIVSAHAPLAAQRDDAGVERDEPPAQITDEQNSSFENYEVRRRSPVLRVGGDFTLAAGDEADDVVVVNGHARIAGTVHGDVSVVFGQAEIGDSANIDGNLIIVGGTVAVSSQARVRDAFIAAGASVKETPGFKPGDAHVVVDPQALGIDMATLTAWITQGLFMGRPLPPTVQRAWIIVFLCLLTYLILLLAAERPVRRCAQTLNARPVTTFLTGLLVMLVAGPVALLLVVSLAGLVVLPFAITGLIIAWIIGKVGVMRWIGARAVPEGQEADAAPSRAIAVRSFAIGAAVLTLAYTMPIVGLLVWTASGVLALGAAVLTLFEGYRRENPSIATAPKMRAATVIVPAPLTASAAVTESAPPLVSPLPPPSPSMSFAEAPPQHPVSPPYTGALPRATFRERLAAFALDIVVVLLTSMVLDLLDFHAVRNFMLLLLLYHIAFWTVKGTTIGGIICQLRLVRLDGQPLQLGDAFIRGLAGVLSGAVAGLGFLWMLKRPAQETWHDKIAGTMVVKVPRHYPA